MPLQDEEKVGPEAPRHRGARARQNQVIIERGAVEIVDEALDQDETTGLFLQSVTNT